MNINFLHKNLGFLADHLPAWPVLCRKSTLALYRSAEQSQLGCLQLVKTWNSSPGPFCPLNIPVKLVDVDKKRKATSLCSVQFYYEQKARRKKKNIEPQMAGKRQYCILCCAAKFSFIFITAQSQSRPQF